MAARFYRGSQDFLTFLPASDHDKTRNLTVFWEYHSENLNEMLPR